MPKKHNKQDEKKAMTAAQIRTMREEEMLDSVYREKTAREKHAETAFIWIAAILCTALLMTALHYYHVLVGKASAFVLPYLWMIPDHSGFLGDFLSKLMELITAILLIILFDFALNINFSTRTRPEEKWKKPVRIVGLVAFGTVIFYAVIARFFHTGFVPPSGSIFSQVMYYLTHLLLVPVTDVLLYLVIPSATVRMILLLIAESREKTELPQLLAGWCIMTFGLLGLSWNAVVMAGAWVIVYAVMQAGACSILYHRTDTVWRPIMLCFGLTGTYYIVSWLLSLL